MKFGKLAQIFLYGIAFIATLYIYSEGINEYNQMRVRIKFSYFLIYRDYRFVILL